MSKKIDEKSEEQIALDAENALVNTINIIKHGLNAEPTYITDDFGNKEKVQVGIETLKPFNKNSHLGDITLGDISIGDGSNFGAMLQGIIKDSLGENPTPDDLRGVATGLLYVGETLRHKVGDSENIETLTDSLNSLQGNELIPLGIAMAFYAYTNTPIRELTGIMTPTKLAHLWQLYSVKQVVQRGSSDMETGTQINAMTMGDNLSLKSRFEHFTFRDEDIENGYATYKYQARQRNWSLNETTSIPLNKTILTFLKYAGGSCDDLFNKSSQNECSPEVTINGQKIIMTIEYEKGTITIQVPEGALKDGDKFHLRTEVVNDNLTDDRGFIEVDITPYRYPATPLSLGTSVNMFDSDRVLVQLGIGLLPLNEKNILDKIIAEIQQLSLDIACSVADNWIRVVDLTRTPNVANADIYKHLEAEIKTISTDMTTKSGVSVGAFLLGGSALEKAFYKGNSVRRDDNRHSGIRPLGLMANSFKGYFVPRHDKENPKVNSDGEVSNDTSLNDYQTIFVFGVAPTAMQRLILVGFTKPFRTERPSIDLDSNRKTWIEGEFMLGLNQDEATHDMAVKLLVKGLD